MKLPARRSKLTTIDINTGWAVLVVIAENEDVSIHCPRTGTLRIIHMTVGIQDVLPLVAAANAEPGRHNVRSTHSLKL